MISPRCVFYPEDSDPLLRIKFTACRKLSWCAGRLQYSATPQPLPVWLTVTACSHPCSHCHSSMEMTGTVHRSDLAKWRQDDVRCRRTIRRWKAWLVSFRSMCGAGGVEQKIFIHPVNSSKQTVPVYSHVDILKQLEQINVPTKKLSSPAAQPAEWTPLKPLALGPPPPYYQKKHC